MKKTMFVIALAATLVVTLFAAGTVSAKGNGPSAPQAPAAGTAYGRGDGTPINLDGILHDALITVYADELGISVDELEARLASGETLAQIAYAEGLSAEELTALLSSARAQALEQAVADGILTQEQADWLMSRPTMQMGGQMGARTARSAGFGARGSMSANCPYYQTTP